MAEEFKRPRDKFHHYLIRNASGAVDPKMRGPLCGWKAPGEAVIGHVDVDDSGSADGVDCPDCLRLLEERKKGNATTLPKSAWMELPETISVTPENMEETRRKFDKSKDNLREWKNPNKFHVFYSTGRCNDGDHDVEHKEFGTVDEAIAFSAELRKAKFDGWLVVVEGVKLKAVDWWGDRENDTMKETE